MDEIFKQYGSIIITAIIVVALIGLATTLSGTTGVIQTTINSIITKMSGYVPA